MSHQQHLENLTTAEEEDKKEVKKSTKKNKSQGKRSKSRKSKHIENLIDDEKLRLKEDENLIEKQERFSEVQDYQLVVPKKKTGLSTKKKSSQQQKQTLNNQHHNNKLSSERQVKLNFFLKKSDDNNNSVSKINNTKTIHSNTYNNNNSTTFTSKYAITQFQRKQSSLEKQLKEKQQILQRMKLDKQIHAQRFNKLKIQSEEYKIKCRQTMEKQLKHYAKLRREEKAEINPRFGYYRQAGWTVFVEGEAILQSKKKLSQLTSRIELLQTNRKTCTMDQRPHLTAQIDHLNKLLVQHKTEMKKLQTQVNNYKETLRLADKQQNCTLAKHNWDLIENRYLPIELLGCGGFGQVYKAYDLQTHTNVAIKINCFEPTKNLQYRDQFIKHVQREVDTLKELNHPNIARLIDEVLIEGKISFVLQYCSGPQLSKYLIKNQFLEEHEARGIIKQLSFALRYMFNQRKRIIHYDLKPANIIFHYGCVKILDFGLCKNMQTQDTKIDLTSQGVGTYWYLPPQTFMDKAQVSPKVDVWSLGVIFYELLYGKRPFGHGINQNKIYQEGIILKALKVDFPTDKKYKVSESAKNFIRQCLKYDSNERLDPQQVYNHQYLQN